MAADMHIHALVGVTEQDVADFQANTLGTRHFNMVRGLDIQMSGRWGELYDKIGETPSFWVGSVSWLKASISGDDEKYIPDPVARVQEAIGEYFPVLDEELRDKIITAFDVPNNTLYGVTRGDELAEWLDAHMGDRLFTISW